MARASDDTQRAGRDASAGDDTRERVLHAAADLLATQGRDAVSTRAVAAAAGVQAPALYRLFGDKGGLLDAVAAYAFESYLETKKEQPPSGDPVRDITRGWDDHVAFGLARPAFYLLMYGEERRSPAAQEADELLRQVMSRAAAAGRLAVSVERASQLAISAAVGVVLTLIATPEEERDPQLTAAVRDSLLATIVVGQDDAAAPAPADPPLVRQATALREALRGGGAPPPQLSDAEQAMLVEWLERLGRSAER